MTTAPRPRQTRTLEVLGVALLTVAVLLLVALAVLPGGSPVASTTLSVDVYGPRGDLVRVALFVFGVGTYVLAATFALELGGWLGRFAAGTAAVWATASAVDAFVSTSRTGQQSLHGLVHIAFAITGLLAQVVIAVAYPVLLRRRLHHVPLASGASSLFVVIAAALFFLGGRDGWVGAGERTVLFSSAVWMVVNVIVADRLEHARLVAELAVLEDPAAVRDLVD